MLYLEKSSLEHLDMKTGQWRDALKWVPGKVPTLPGRVSAPGPHPTAPPPSGTSGLARAIESPALPRVRLSLASAEMLHLSPSGGGGGQVRRFLPLTAPSRKSAIVQKLTIYDKFGHSQHHQMLPEQGAQTLRNSKLSASTPAGRTAKGTYLVGCSRPSLPLSQGPRPYFYTGALSFGAAFKETAADDGTCCVHLIL